MEFLLERIVRKPESELIDSALNFLKKDYTYGLERLRESPLHKELAPPEPMRAISLLRDFHRKY